MDEDLKDSVDALKKEVAGLSEQVGELTEALNRAVRVAVAQGGR